MAVFIHVMTASNGLKLVKSQLIVFHESGVLIFIVGFCLPSDEHTISDFRISIDDLPHGGL